MTTPYQPTLPNEIPFTDAEHAYIDESPVNLYPENQDSNYGLLRRIYSDYVQDLIDQQITLYNERFIDTSKDFLDVWETEVGLPISEATYITQRRANIQNRLVKGPFTRTRRNSTVENFIIATVGEAIQITPAGVALSVAGVPIFSGESDVKLLYNIVENLTGFSYTVYLKSTVTPDLVSLTRELNRITPAGISFTITSVADPFWTVAGSPLTFTGDVITDAIRTTGVKGDGTPTRQSVGIYGAMTNGITTFTNNIATGWGKGGINTATSSGGGPGADGYTTVNKVSGTGGQIYSPNVTVTPGQVRTFSFFAARGSLANAFLRVWDATHGADIIPQTSYFSQIPASGWGRVQITYVVPAGCTQVTNYIIDNTGSSLTGDIYLAWAQDEVGEAATVYVANGGTSVAGRITAPSSLLTTTQGWFAARVRTRWADTATTLEPRLITWGATSGWLFCQYDVTGNNFILQRSDGTTTTTASTSAIPISPGQYVTIVGAWTAAGVRLSINGSPFVFVAGTALPTTPDATIDIGRSSTAATRHFNGEFFWLATGKGTLTDADAAALYALGNTEPNKTNLNSLAQITAVMPFVDANYNVPR